MHRRRHTHTHDKSLILVDMSHIFDKFPVILHPAICNLCFDVVSIRVCVCADASLPNTIMPHTPDKFIVLRICSAGDLTLFFKIFFQLCTKA